MDFVSFSRFASLVSDRYTIALVVYHKLVVESPSSAKEGNSLDLRVIFPISEIPNSPIFQKVSFEAEIFYCGPALLLFSIWDDSHCHSSCWLIATQHIYKLIPPTTHTHTHQTFNMAEFVKSTLAAAGPGVVLFSKSYCPYCVRAKQALLSIGIEPVVVELDQRADGSRLIQIALMQMTGKRTVPSAWLDGKYIGGSDEVVDGISSGLFSSVPAGVSKEMAQKAGLQKCGANDGIPCLCDSA